MIAALCLPAAVFAQDVPQGAATISDPGGSDLSGFTIVIDPSGHAWAIDGAGHTTAYVNLSVTQAFFTDLAAAGSLAQLPGHPCQQDVVIGWNGQRTPNIACSSDLRALRLMGDVIAIQKALYVQSYHTSASVARSTVSYGAAPANGQTYSQVSAASLADPTNARLAAQANTLFRGETLRGLLLNAYGWSQVAFYAFWAAIGLSVAAFVVLCTLVFEVVVAPRTERAGGRQPLPA